MALDTCNAKSNKQRQKKEKNEKNRAMWYEKIEWAFPN